MKQRSAWILSLGLLVMACGDEPEPVVSSDGSSGTAGDSGTTMPPTTMTPTTDAMTSDASTTGPGEGSTTAAVDSSGTAGGSSGTEGSSSGAPEDPAYPPCMPDADPMCPEPYDQCYAYFPEGYSACTQMCRDDTDCPQPASGDAPAICAGINGDECVLDCANDATCPDGMECVDIPGSAFQRCGWPDA